MTQSMISAHECDRQVLASMSDKLSALQFRIFEHNHPPQWVCTWQKSASNIHAEPGGHKTGESAAGDIVDELENKGGYIRHEKGWSMISSGADVMWRKIAIRPSTQKWVCVRQGSPSSVHARPRGDKTGFTAAGDVVTALSQRAGWIRHEQGWSMIKSGGSVEWMQLAMPTTQQWACVWKKSASYIRKTPGGTKVGESNAGDVVFELERNDGWVRHSRGWSLIESGTHVMWQPLNNTELAWHKRGAMSKLYDVIDVDGSGGLDLNEIVSFMALLKAGSTCPKENKAADYMIKALAELATSLGDARTCHKDKFVDFEPSDYPEESWKVMAGIIDKMDANPEICSTLLAAIGSA